jgi:hypothetical protein
VEYIVEKGNDFFAVGADYESERIGDYSYRIGEGGSRGLDRLISPHAKTFLKRIKNRKGRII